MVQGNGGILWFALGGKVAIPLVVSPALALLVTLALLPAVRHIIKGWKGSCLCVNVAQEALIPVGNFARAERAAITPPTFITIYDVPENCGGGKGVALSLTSDTFHRLSSGLVSFARGLNDAPKIVAPVATTALIAGNDLSGVWIAFPLAALAMGMGSLWGGLRVTKSLAEKVTERNSVGSLTANLTTALLVIAAARVGLPVSTTHVSSGAIVGVGLRRGGGINWRTLGNFLLAWVVTLPAAGVVAAVSLWVLSLV
jgi:inorganic phosphate transporter, PiT family